jgi:PAS domain S-box-containing protein
VSRSDGAAGSGLDALEAGGQVGRDLLAVDWEATSLGPPSSWPQSLTTLVTVVLRSRFSMWMAWGPDLTFFCNDAYRRDTLAAKYPWALGRPAREVWAEIWPDIGPRIEHVMRTGEATWDESLLLFLQRSGFREETYHTFSYSPITDEDGAVAGMLCVVTEETERVIAQRHLETLRALGSDPTALRSEDDVLRAMERHLQDDLRSMPFSLVYLFDDDGVAHLRAASGVPAGHPVAVHAIAPDEDDPPWPALALLGSRTVTVDDLAARFGDVPTGAWDEPPRQALIAPLRQQGSDRPYGFLVAGLTPLRPLDDRYRTFVDLVAGQIAAGLATARAYEGERLRAEQLAELDRVKTAFFTNVSHELRTPLTLLLGPAEDALADDAHALPDVQRERLELIARNGERLLRLVNALLDFSRLESGRAAPRYQAVDLAALTADLVSMFRSAVERAGLGLEVDCAPLGETVFVDPEMWAKIVLNLLSNALKFTFDGAITVRVAADDGWVATTVTDTGVGIADEDQERLFERFHRVGGAVSRSHEGSGIGLALVAELTQLLGGEVSVHSVPGDGTAFTVRLPVGRDHLPPGAIVEHGGVGDGLHRHADGFLSEALRWLEQAEAVPGTPAPDAPRILIADDNADMRAYMTRLLSAEFRVTEVADGQAALEAARAAPPDLVLTDVMMPRLDGFGLLAALREHPATLHVPVVMVSARAGEEGTIEGLEAGADDYLVKPFASRELLARVHANLELDRVRRARDELDRSQTLLDQAQRLAMVGSWEADLRSGRLRASAELLRILGLTPQQFEALSAENVVESVVHPADQDRVRAAIERALGGASLHVELWMVRPDGGRRRVAAHGELVRDAAGEPVTLRGSAQDVTEQRRAEEALAGAQAQREASAREHRIADELQRSLLPPRSFTPVGLEVATFYRAGAEGTQVGGDWYDVIELPGDRTALVIGDVMGRGVQAAAVMGQIRTAVRAYARLGLQPADIMALLDGVVVDLGDDHIVTCIYAVYDPATTTLTYASAGHLPPIVVDGGSPRVLSGPAGPPLGTGEGHVAQAELALGDGALVTLYTDGLVERRDSDLATSIARLAAAVGTATGDLGALPEQLIATLLTEAVDDDVALLAARVRRPQDGGA